MGFLDTCRNKKEALETLCSIADSECLSVNYLWCYQEAKKRFNIADEDYLPIISESVNAALQGMQKHIVVSDMDSAELVKILFRERYKTGIWHRLMSYNKSHPFSEIVNVPDTWEELEILLNRTYDNIPIINKTIDHYLFSHNCLSRLVEEYYKYGKIIISYDFDDTVHDFHIKGYHYGMVIKLLQELRPYANFICFTASKESRYDYIKEYLSEHSIPIDKLNENIEGTPEGRKIYANIHLDDRAGLGECYLILKDFLDTIKDNK